MSEHYLDLRLVFAIYKLKMYENLMAVVTVVLYNQPISFIF